VSIVDLAVSNCSDCGASMRSRRETVLRGFVEVVEALLVGIDELSVGECNLVSKAGGCILHL
jgi:hypothetical protein